MFDWDQHQEAELHPVPITVYTAPAAPAPRGWNGQWLAPIAVAGLAMLAWNAWHAVTPPEQVEVSLAAFGAVSAATAPAPEPLRLVLEVYGPREQARFIDGLARFDNRALFAYAAQIEADLAAERGPVDADLRDALTLARQELDRRGLAQSGVNIETP